eukprot:Skav217625  [mRNA]  locus=scaffold2172:760321:762789:+ [translate_table: standard]
MNPQGLANTAKLQHYDQSLLDAISKQMDPSKFKVQELVNSVPWMVPQDISNLVWAHGTLRFEYHPLLQLADVSHSLASQFSTQHLSNVAWSFATLRHALPPALTEVVHQEALSDLTNAICRSRLSQFRPDALATLGWALARTTAACEPLHQQLLEAMASRATRLLRSQERFSMKRLDP